jgi:tape measure domain-containing protein
MTVMSGMALAGSILGVTALATKYADLGQKSRGAFSMMLGSKALGEDAFRESRALAIELGMGIDEVKGSYQRFLSMGFDRGESVEIIKMGADMTALGASTEKVSSVLDAMGKIKATGSLQGDELMMLAEAGINTGAIYDRLGAKFGKTRAQVVKMKEAGKISAEDAIAAIKSTVLATTGQSEFGAARRNIMTSTLSGAFQEMKAVAIDSFIGIGDAAGPQLTKMVSAISKMVGEFMKSDAGKSFLADAAVLAGRVADGITESLPLVKEFIGQFKDGFGETMDIMAEAFRDIFSPGDKAKTSETFAKLGKDAGQIAAALVSTALVMGMLSYGAIKFGAALKDYVVGEVEWIGKLIFFISDSIDNLTAKLKSSKMTAMDWMNPLGYVTGKMGESVAATYRAIPGESGKISAAGKPGVAGNTTNTVTVPVTVNAPPGTDAAAGAAFGRGVASGAERGMMSALGGANLASGT